MMNRREALVRLGTAALIAGLPAASSLAQASENDALDARLRKDIARLEPRVNSEEGVPVLLACVNLVGPQPAAHNSAVAAEFRQTAAAWERIHPHPKDTDVGKVIEVLAYRDFSKGGTF
jgi:hypothetical protein